MRERLRIFILLTAFWLSYMVTARIIFLSYNYDSTSDLTFKEIFLSCWFGLRMDASISAYFLATYGLLLTISAIRNASWIPAAIKVTTIALLAFCSATVVVDMELYRHWGFRINTTPFLYIGKEAMGSIPLFVFLKGMFIFAALFTGYLLIFRKRIFPYVKYLEPTKIRSAIFLFLISAFMFIPIRGSFTVAPMNTGFVYYHNSKPYANHSAVNVVWNFLRSLIKGSSVKYADNFFDQTRTEKIFRELYEQNSPTKAILKSRNPNVILVILESFTADVIEPLGGMKGITPNLNQLCREGILFDNIYSSGDRTDKGLISILSGYPAQPTTSIIKEPAKSQRLPLLNKELIKLGYHTSFIYGGDVDFAYFRSYLNTSGFQHITDLEDFDENLYTSKWGVHDHFMFQKAIQELDTTKEKFFKVILTLSSHEPFDVPQTPIIKDKDEESLFINSCHYTDKSLGTFIQYCKRQSWWQNTLVIITADHGHRLPGNKELNSKERFHIPLLMIGGTVEKDTVVHTIGNQTDISNTLLGQINKPDPAFLFSKNLLSDDAKSFAAYFYNDGYGFIKPHCYIVYDNPGKQFIKVEGAHPSDLEESKAYQQKLFTNYNNMDKTIP
jgi:phosphoglycerol transferase MdoB-like AlkP superfamily enzyme